MKAIQLFFIVNLLIILSITNAFGQTQELKKILNAYKTKGVEESKTILKDYSFNVDTTYTISEYSDINGTLFDTDLPEVKGYRAIINCKLVNKSHELIDKSIMVIMYFDKERKRWAVYALRGETDATEEYTIAKNDVEANIFYTKKEFVYRNLAYWSMMAGKLKDANKYIELGIAEAKFNNNSSFTTNILEILKAIR